jgi:hypothetical protein
MLLYEGGQPCLGNGEVRRLEAFPNLFTVGKHASIVTPRFSMTHKILDRSFLPGFHGFALFCASTVENDRRKSNNSFYVLL